jgi:hypothetical protein
MFDQVAFFLVALLVLERPKPRKNRVEDVAHGIHINLLGLSFIGILFGRSKIPRVIPYFESTCLIFVGVPPDKSTSIYIRIAKMTDKITNEKIATRRHGPRHGPNSEREGIMTYRLKSFSL